MSPFFTVAADPLPPIEIPATLRTALVSASCPDCGFVGSARSADGLAAIREDHTAYQITQQMQSEQ